MAGLLVYLFILFFVCGQPRLISGGRPIIRDGEFVDIGIFSLLTVFLAAVVSRPAWHASCFLFFGAACGVSLLPTVELIQLPWGEVAVGKWRLPPSAQLTLAFPVLLGLLCRWSALASNNWQIKQLSKLRKTHCHQCRYPLFGLASHRCPECGTPFSHAIPEPPVSVESNENAPHPS